MAESPAISAMVDVLRPFLRSREKVFLCSFENARWLTLQVDGQEAKLTLKKDQPEITVQL